MHVPLSTLEQLLHQATHKHLLDEYRFVGDNVNLRIGQVCLSLDQRAAVQFLRGLITSAAKVGVPFSRQH